MIKTILIKCDLAGRGIVNFDSKEQRFTLSKHGIFTGLNENVKLGKKAFTKTGVVNENGNEIYDYKVKISADCLRNAIFGKDVEVVNGYFEADPFILATYILSPTGLARGYMFVGREKTDRENTIRRKSPLTVTDAIQTNDAKSEMEIGSTTGARVDNSMYFSEKVGDITYSFKGQIDIKQLQFLSADMCFDRFGIDPDIISSGEASAIIANHYGEGSEYYQGIFSSMSKFTSSTYGEYGILFSNEICEKVIKYTLKNILALNIVRSNSFAATTGLKIKLVDNIIGTGQKMEDEENWIELRNEEDIDNLDLSNLYQFYEPADEDEIENREKMIKEFTEASEDRKKAKKEEKKARKDATQK